MLRDLHGRAGQREARGLSRRRRRGWSPRRWLPDWPLLVAVVRRRTRLPDEPRLASWWRKIPKAIAGIGRAIKARRGHRDSPGDRGGGRLCRARHPSVGSTEDPLVLVLDGVADPGNAGTLLRSALGAGVQHGSGRRAAAWTCSRPRWSGRGWGPTSSCAGDRPHLAGDDGHAGRKAGRGGRMPRRKAPLLPV